MEMFIFSKTNIFVFTSLNFIKFAKNKHLLITNISLNISMQFSPFSPVYPLRRHFLRSSYRDINKWKSEMRSFKSNENIHKKEGGSYYVVSANKASSVTLQLPGNESQRKHTTFLRISIKQSIKADFYVIPFIFWEKWTDNWTRRTAKWNS